MHPPFVLAAHAQRYVTHSTINHAAGSSTWTAVLAGLIPILGIAAAAILVYAFVRQDGEAGKD
jgi:hypothetical protein